MIDIPTGINRETDFFHKRTAACYFQMTFYRNTRIYVNFTLTSTVAIISIKESGKLMWLLAVILHVYVFVCFTAQVHSDMLHYICMTGFVFIKSSDIFIFERA